MESPIDYINRLDRELGLGGGNLTREDLVPTTPTQLAFNLGLITNVSPFENPLESLSNEQQERELIMLLMNSTLTIN